jgi:pimeloyl-ACP methyl ester carboxylesterase
MVPQPDGKFFWHMGFQSVPDIAEMLIRGHEREYISVFFSHYAYDPTAITPQDIDVYEDAIKQPGALRGGLEYYKAFFQSAEQVRALAEEKLTIPILAIAGEASCDSMTLGSMQQVGEDVRGGVVDRCGHWMAEERPEHIVDLLTAFYAETANDRVAS